MSLESIVKPLAKMSNRLATFSVTKAKEAEECEQAIKKYGAALDDAMSEAERANKIKAKIDALLEV